MTASIKTLIARVATSAGYDSRYKETPDWVPDVQQIVEKVGLTHYMEDSRPSLEEYIVEFRGKKTVDFPPKDTLALAELLVNDRIDMQVRSIPGGVSFQFIGRMAR